MSANALIESLNGLRRRVKAFAVAYGVALVVALAVGILLAILLIDYELSLDPAGRLMLILIGLAGWAYAAWHLVVRPAMAKVTISHIAGSLEHTYPQFDDRLRSTVDFVGHDVPGSQTMKERVVDQATELARGVDLEQVIVTRPVYLSMAGGAAAIVLLVALSFVAGSHIVDIALNRLALGHDAWPKSVQIALASDLPSHVWAGEHVDVAVRLTKGDRASRQTMLEYRYGEGPWQQLVMSRAADGVYTAALDARLGSDEKSATLQTRVIAGDAELDKSIGVVPKLEISAVQAGVTPPAYVQPQSQTTIDLSQRPAVAVTGSDIALTFAFNKDLAAGVPVELRPLKDPNAPDNAKPAPLPTITWDTHPAAGTAVAHFQADQSFRFSVHATDVDHFNNVGSEEYQVIVHADQLPTVQIEEPRHSDEYVANAKFPIKAVADDDFGVAAARLVINRIAVQSGAKPTSGINTWTIDLVKEGKAVAANADWQQVDSTSDRKHYTLGYDWDLAALNNANLKPGDVLEYCLQVKDNFLLNGKDHDWVSSGKLRASIISADQLKTEAENELQNVAQAIEQTRKDQDRNKADTSTLKDTLDQRKKYDEADQALADRLANQQNNLAVQTQQMTDKLSALDKRMDENQLPEQDPLRQAAQSGKQALQDVVNDPMHQAKQSLNAAKDSPPPDAKASPKEKAQDAGQRSSQLAQSTTQQQQASDDLGNAEKKLRNFDTLDKELAKVKELEAHQAQLNKDYQNKLQSALGKTPNQMSPQEQKDANALTAQQNQLQKDTQSTIKDMATKGAQPNPSDPDSSQAMAQAAQAGQDKDVTGNQGQSSSSMQQNQQNNAQQAQDQADLGLKKMEQILDDAKLAKLEKLREKLAKIQQLLQELAQHQAGHNMDDLLLQGGTARLYKESKDVWTQLCTISMRSQDTLASLHPDLAGLTSAQERTELNARSLLKDTDDLKDPTASAKIEAAAGQMERAAVELQNNRLAEAYEPPQVEALHDLLEAKTAVDKAKEDADKKADAQKKEAIRQAYVDLLKAQHEQVDVKTTNIGNLPTDQDGELSRAALAQARLLPAEQQKCADTAKDIGERLKALNSIVYSWANDDIISSMGEVKDDLAKPDTGRSTQAEQQGIEDQLTAMIDELKEVPPPKDPFDKRPSGAAGGGGGGKPKAQMPPDAELRLLKDLQLAINRNTIVDNDMPNKDEHKLTALGDREGNIRSLFDQMIQKATQGKVKLGPIPDDNLPDTAKPDDIDNQELEQGLLGQNANEDSVTQGVKLTGARMGRVMRRLANNKDPGQVTQDIEKRIVVGIDDMIKLAQQQQQQQGSGSGKPQPGQQPGPPKPGQGGPQVANGGGNGPHKEGGSTPARTSSLPPGGSPNVDPSAMVQNDPNKWANLSPRQIAAMRETGGDTAIGRYTEQVNEYYKTLSQQESKQQSQ